jgi:hypothetical protein
MSNINLYKKINKSFTTKVIFRLGDDAGFFSEYNNMILAMLYCLDHRYQFVLSSKNANFSFDIGWNDYFEPFANECNAKWIMPYNHRPYSIINIRLPFLLRVLRRLKIYTPHTDRSFFLSLLKRTNKILLTQDIFVQARTLNTNENFEFSTLGIQGSIRSACRKLVELTWRFNPNTQSNINDKIQSLQLPERYLGFHIRSGDKNAEYPLISPFVYVENAKRFSNLTKAFVLTDDYKVILELQNEFPTWTFYTLCEKNEHGYYHSEFTQQPKNDIKEAHIKLFASIEILAKADHFIGTYSSNPGMYLGMRMDPEKCHGVDFDKWRIW